MEDEGVCVEGGNDGYGGCRVDVDYVEGEVEDDDGVRGGVMMFKE